MCCIFAPSSFACGRRQLRHTQPKDLIEPVQQTLQALSLPASILLTTTPWLELQHGLDCLGLKGLAA